MRRSLILLLLVWHLAAVHAATLDAITRWVADGHWGRAHAEIAQELGDTNLSFATREGLLFQSDRMRRMALDFNQTRDESFREARGLAPSLTEEQFARWEQAGAVEFLDVDGTRRYFRSAAENLFRINPAARALLSRHGTDVIFGTPNYRLEDIRAILASYDKTGEMLNTPKTWRVTYQLRVKPGVVPPGEIIRAWLPLPHALNRQSNIRLISTDPARSLPAGTNDALASVYLEKKAAAAGPTVFRVVFECTSRAFYEPMDPARVTPVDTNDPALAPFLRERPSQIVFSDAIKKLSPQIVGTETNPYLKARRIFQWVFENVPWASAREYSTLDCLPEYALAHGHGDCGMEAMTFMTLCRYNGIPAHWESGWATGTFKDMHDWCEIYLAPYGWVPVDVCYGLVDSADEREKWFYLGGIDSFRFAVNTDYAQPVYPAKTFFRSEIVDFQRGEVEWRGGNLYFDQWHYDFNVTEAPAGG